MDVEDKPPGVPDLSPLSCTVRPTVSPASGLFSIESILKSGGYHAHTPHPRPPQPPAESGNLHGLKQEEDSELEDPRSGLLGPAMSLAGMPGASLASDTANCQEDSGQLSQKIFALVKKYLYEYLSVQRMTRRVATTGRSGRALPSRRRRSRRSSPSLRKTNICPCPSACSSPNSSS